MARSKVLPTRDRDGRRAYDFACECGTWSDPPVSSPEEANRQREEHQRTEHDQ